MKKTHSLKVPIFLSVISERCGKTLLRKILNINSSVRFSPGETKFMSQIWSRRRLIGSLKGSEIPEKIEKYLRHNILREDSREALQIQLEEGNLITQEDEFNILLNTKYSDIIDEFSTTSKDYKDLYFSILKVFSDKDKSFFIGDKDPTANPFVVSLVRFYPHAKVINLIRDARGIITSMISTKSNLNLIEMSCRVKESYSFAFEHNKKISGKNYYEINYESLILKPKEELIHLCSFLGIDFEKDMLNPKLYLPNSDGKKYKKGFDKTMISIWKKKLSIKQIVLIEYIMGKELSQRGYKCLTQKSKKYINFKTRLVIFLYSKFYYFERRLILISSNLGLGSSLAKLPNAIHKKIKDKNVLEYLIDTDFINC